MSDCSFEERYQANDIPWDRTIPDHNLVQTVQEFSIAPCRVLDLGCGTGINSVWLAQQQFDVTGIDLSPTAIERAEEQARNQKIPINGISGDFLDSSVLNKPFGFIFDRGCFHCFEGHIGRSKCANRIDELLAANGLWLSLIGNADDTSREGGPPTMTAAELTGIVEPCFEILSLNAGFFGGEQEDPPKAWICLMKKRS